MKNLILIFFASVAFNSCTSSEKKEQEDVVVTNEEELPAILKQEVKKIVQLKIEQSENFLDTKTVLSGKVEIFLPEDFELMKAEMLSLKYPMEGRRPTEVYTNKNGSINVAFNHTNNQATQEQLPQYQQLFKRQFNQPQIEFIKSEISVINGRDFIIMEFITPAADSKIYNLMFITSLENQLLLGTFNCTTNKLPEWESKGKKIVNSIKVF